MYSQLFIVLLLKSEPQNYLFVALHVRVSIYVWATVFLWLGLGYCLCLLVEDTQGDASWPLLSVFLITEVEPKCMLGHFTTLNWNWHVSRAAFLWDKPMIDPRLFGSHCIKGTTVGKDSSVFLMHCDPNDFGLLTCFWIFWNKYTLDNYL